MAKAIKKTTTKTATVAAAPKAKKAKAAKKATGPLASMKALVKEAAKTVAKGQEKPAYKARIAQAQARKEKVVAGIVDQIARAGEDAGALKTRLVKASNSQLLRLERVAAEAKKAGGRSKMASSIASALGRVKDKDYVKKLEALPLPQLMDVFKTSARRNAASK